MKRVTYFKADLCRTTFLCHRNKNQYVGIWEMPHEYNFIRDVDVKVGVVEIGLTGLELNVWEEC